MFKTKPPILIRPFQPVDQNAARALILAGLSEHWGSLDPDKNHDLDAIAVSYQEAVFLVAEQAGQIIGTGALIARTPQRGEIVRMSVARNQRRQGIGRMILQNLLAHAAQLNYRQVTLETTATWQAAIDFYLAHGFRISHQQDGDLYFEMDLP